jgi:hypothetical protein
MQVVPCMIFVFISVHDEFCWGVVPNMNASVFPHGSDLSTLMSVRQRRTARSSLAFSDHPRVSFNGFILHGSSSVQDFVFINVGDEFCWGVVPNMNALVFLVDVPRFSWPSRFLIPCFYLVSGRARSPLTSAILFLKSPRCTALLPLSHLPKVLRAVAVCTSCIPAFSPHL